MGSLGELTEACHGGRWWRAPSRGWNAHWELSWAVAFSWVLPAAPGLPSEQWEEAGKKQTCQIWDFSILFAQQFFKEEFHSKLMHFDNAVWECTRSLSGNASPYNGLIEVVGLSVILQSSHVSSPWKHVAWPCKPSPSGQPPQENAGGRENQSSPKQISIPRLLKEYLSCHRANKEESHSMWATNQRNLMRLG